MSINAKEALNELNQEQTEAVRLLFIDACTVIQREVNTFIEEKHPELTIKYQVRLGALDGEKKWLGVLDNMRHGEAEKLFGEQEL